MLFEEWMALPLLSPMWGCCLCLADYKFLATSSPTWWLNGWWSCCHMHGFENTVGLLSTMLMRLTWLQLVSILFDIGANGDVGF